MAMASSATATAESEMGDCKSQSLICPLCKRRVMIVINIKENWTKFYTVTSESDGDEYQQQQQQQQDQEETAAEDAQQKFVSSLSCPDDPDDDSCEDAAAADCSNKPRKTSAGNGSGGGSGRITEVNTNNGSNCETNPDADSEYKLVKCTSCDKYIGLTNSTGPVQTIDEILHDPTKSTNGWFKVEGENDRRALFILNQLIYKKYEPPDESQLEVEYAMPSSTDLVKLLWINEIASGFFSMKLKGTLNPDTMEVYSMSTLDTIFICKKYRRQGYASATLQDILTEFPEQNIGFSYPISFSMEQVLSKHLEQHGPQNRLRFWEISGCGTQGNCRNLWLNLQRSARKKK